MNASDLQFRWAQLFVSSLYKIGVSNWVASPGSRSTPLISAAAMHQGVRINVFTDERVASFFALGQARSSGHPTVLLCTSGTAAAHYYPALIEAAQAYVPLIVITADRPNEDYFCAASQTIDQVKMFGGFVRHFAELGIPEHHPLALRNVVRVAAQAVHCSRFPTPGPVHVNARFRKPLEPENVGSDVPRSDPVFDVFSSEPPTVMKVNRIPDDTELCALVSLLQTHRKGIIVCGPVGCGTDQGVLRSSVQQLSRKTGYPIWAESASGVRFGGGKEICGSFDLFLRNPVVAKMKPDLILELGLPVTSGFFGAIYSKDRDCIRVSISPFGWNDPHAICDRLVLADPAEYVPKLCMKLDAPECSSAWKQSWEQIDGQVWETVSEVLSDGIFHEAIVVRELINTLCANATLLIGNSLPIRDLDWFCPPTDKPLKVIHQRGASGIDGFLSAAAGSKNSADTPLAVLIGDLCAQHDLGGLAAIAQSSGPLVVVIVQNGGGQIFGTLPVGNSQIMAPYLSSFFLTPQGVDFGLAVAAFGLPFVRVFDKEALRKALERGLSADTPLIIEAVVSANQSIPVRKRLFAQIAQQKFAQTHHCFFHGFLGSPNAWRTIANELHLDYTAEFLPGHGVNPILDAGATWNDVVDSIAQNLPKTPAVLCGYSLGARLALSLAIRHPDRVLSLCLFGVNPGFRSEPERAARSTWETQLEQRLHKQGLADFVKEWEELPLFASQKLLPETVVAQQRADRLGHDRHGIAWALRVLGAGKMPDLWPHLSSLNMPITLVTGTGDENCTAIARQMQAVNPHIVYEVIADCGHNPLLEKPERVAEILFRHGKRTERCE